MVQVALYSDIHFRILKNKKSQLTSSGITLIKNKLLGDTAFNGWVAKVAGNNEQDKNEILQEYLKVGTNMIDHILEQKDDPGLELLHKAIESSDPKYNDVSIAINYPAPTEEGPVYKTFELKAVEDFELSDNGKAVITEQGESHIYEQFYGEKVSREFLAGAAFPDTVMDNMIKSARDTIDDVLSNDKDYKEILEDWQADRLKDSYKKFVPNLVFRTPLQYKHTN